VLAVVFTVSVEVSDPVPLISTEPGARAQVGLVAPLGETEQVRSTVPVKPLVGITVMVEVPLLPFVIAGIVAGLGVRVKLAVEELPVTAT
jgi:hypothetical protein